MIENTTGINAGKPATQQNGIDPSTIEVELEDDDKKESKAEEEKEDEFNENLVEYLAEESPGVLTRLAGDLLKDIEDDLAARKDWEDMMKEGLKLMGLKMEHRTEPWVGASGVFHPMITEATVKFQAETIMESFPASGPVKSKILGKPTREKEEAAKRVTEDMNYNLTDVMVEFRPDHERMLFNLAGAGSAFKKVYMDAALDRQTSVFCPAEDVILPYSYTDMNTCPRVTHRMRKYKAEVEAMQHDGFWRDDIDVGEPPKMMVNTIQDKKAKESGVSAAYDNRFLIYEMCVNLDLEGFEDEEDGEPTGKPLPYIVTILDTTKTILAIRRNWKEDDEKKRRRQHFVHYVYVPGYGAYGFGLFHLIGGFAKNATSLMRQLIDAGTLSNLPGGLKSRGLRIKGDDTPIGPGEFRDVDLGSGGIKDNIMLLPYKEPSQVLAGLLQTCVDEGRRMSATADMNASDMSNQAPVGSTLAILERNLKTLTAIQARVHYSFKQELQLIAEIIRDCTPDDYDYDVDAPQGRRAKYDDYRHVEIIPVSDPNASTLAQRIVKYQAVIQLSATAPDIYDLPELHRRVLDVLGVPHPEKLVPVEDDLKSTDPAQENQNILLGKPVKVFAPQNHDAHLQVHMAMQQDPLIMAAIRQNPKAPVIMAALEAHKAEHVGFKYRIQLAQAMGMQLPTYDDEHPITPQQEFQLSMAMAQAAPMLLAQSKAMAAQQQAQKNAQDPVLQAELIDQQVKQGDLQRKMRLDQATIQLEQQKLQLEQQKIQIEAQKAGVDPATMQAELALKQQQAQAQMQVSVSKAQQDMMLKQQQAQQRAQLEQVRLQQQSESEKARLQAELMSKQQQMALGAAQVGANVQIAKQRHSEEQRRAEERHKEELKLRAQAAAQQKTLAAKAAAKPSPRESK